MSNIKLFGEELMAAFERVFDQQAFVGFAEGGACPGPLYFQKSRGSNTTSLCTVSTGGSGELSLSKGRGSKVCLRSWGCRLMARLKKGKERDGWKGQLGRWFWPLLVPVSVWPRVNWHGWELVLQGEGFIFRWEIDWADSKAQHHPPWVF